MFLDIITCLEETFNTAQFDTITATVASYFI